MEEFIKNMEDDDLNMPEENMEDDDEDEDEEEEEEEN